MRVSREESEDTGVIELDEGGQSKLLLVGFGNWRSGSNSSMLRELWRGTELDLATAGDEARQGVRMTLSTALAVASGLGTP